MLGKILLLPISGLMWIGEQIQERTNTEFDAQEDLHKQLLILQLRFDMGELSEEDFDIQEEQLLLKIQSLEEESRLDLESEEDEDYPAQSEFIDVFEENELNQDQCVFVKEYEDNENLVLSP
ncbi:gas vesicle protein GvpG [Nostoc sp. CHAB 5836]|uniref:gas vesicle protein GvpG n=1 Tax=Nostoc sp. CHAB 5836 TaxID=2780404 RepID=UPI001E5B9230|nr:gas vesicle protein GvpG [Nostoc sp. CHAB 5836]MCC5617695.1 gas vesicle protein GvpG [Nostoc sp. CHAB 5836]